MSIASEITRISGNVADAYTAANAKGATMPVTQNSDNLATTISTIQTGTTPTGTKSITANGIYDVTDFASADVQVPTTAPAYYIEKTVDANGKLNNSANIIDLTGVTDVGAFVLAYTYYNNGYLREAVDLSSLTTVGGANGCGNMFYGCSGITSVDLSSLTTVSGTNGCGNMFYGCSGITSVVLSSLTTVGGSNGCYSMFHGCSGITSVDLSSLTTVSGTNACNSMFRDCTSLTTLSFPALISTSLGSNTNQFNNMLFGVTGCTVHFPSNLQSVIGSWPDVINGFGGTNTTILFDLPATA